MWKPPIIQRYSESVAGCVCDTREPSRRKKTGLVEAMLVRSAAAAIRYGSGSLRHRLSRMPACHSTFVTTRRELCQDFAWYWKL